MDATTKSIVYKLSKEQKKKCILENIICGSVDARNIKKSRRGMVNVYGINSHDGVDVTNRLKLKILQRKQKK